MLWAVLSLSSAILWGLAYVYYDEVLNYISTSSLIVLTHLAVGVIFLAHGIYSGVLGKDIAIMKSNSNAINYVLIIIALSALANMCLFVGMQMKNATLAGMLEIAYPFFTAIFAWLIFKENTISLGSAIGGVLVVLGITSIIYFENIAK